MNKILYTSLLVLIVGSMLICRFTPDFAIAAPPDPATEKIKTIFGIDVVENAAGRVMVARVFPRSPAAIVNIRMGDLIRSADKIPVNSLAELIDVLNKSRPGDRVDFLIERDGRQFTSTIVGSPPLEAKVTAEKATPDAPARAAGFLGMFLAEDDKGRVVVSRVAPGSLADKAGLDKGDYLLSVDGREQPTLRDLLDFAARLMDQKRPGDEVRLRIRRDDVEMSFHIAVPLVATLQPVERRTEVIVTAPSSSPLSVRVGMAMLHPHVDRNLSGFVLFFRTERGVEIQAHVAGLAPEMTYRMLIHEFGDLGDLPNESAGGIFDPRRAEHILPNERAVPFGNLGPLVSDRQGTAIVQMMLAGAELEGPNSLIGRAITIHASRPGTGALNELAEGVGVIGLGHPRRETELRR